MITRLKALKFISESYYSTTGSLEKFSDLEKTVSKHFNNIINDCIFILIHQTSFFGFIFKYPVLEHLTLSLRTNDENDESKEYNTLFNNLVENLIANYKKI